MEEASLIFLVLLKSPRTLELSHQAHFTEKQTEAPGRLPAHSQPLNSGIAGVQPVCVDDAVSTHYVSVGDLGKCLTWARVPPANFAPPK
jgi:hypothetical protein